MIEAYRHLVEGEGIPADLVRPRMLYTVPVRVERVLDLTDPGTLTTVGLTPPDLSSDIDDYDACQQLAAAAHQLRWHGILAPAAAGSGTTLALFRDRLTLHEVPTPSAHLLWQQLPPDPRRLRIIHDRGDPRRA